MKITVITPLTTGKYKDDTTMFCEGLEKYCGHEVIRAPLWYHNGSLVSNEEFDINQIVGSDLIWAPYEPLIPVALFFKKEFNIPVVGHFEIIPPGRVSLDAAEYEWMASNRPSLHPIYKEYKFYAEEFDTCDVKTSIDQYSIFNLERLLGRKVKDKIHIKPYPLDNELLEQFKDESLKEKYQVCSVLRLVSHKKIHHVLRALSLLKNPPKYVIVGTGPEEEKLKKMAKEYGLDVEFKGLADDKEKAKVIQESMFAIQPWSWLPMGECAFFKKASLVYDSMDTRLKMKDLPYYTEWNNPVKLAESIEKLSNDKKLRENIGSKAHVLLKEGQTDIHFLKEAVEILNKIFKEVKKE